MKFSMDHKVGCLLALVLTVSLLFTSCDKTPDPELSIAQKEYSIEAAGGDIVVSVSSNVTLSASPSAGWITLVAPAAGESGGTWRFSASRNDSYDSRSATIRFSSPSGGVSESVSITQAQQDAIIAGSLDYQLYYEAQTLSLPVSSNVDYSVSTSASWIKHTGTRGLSSKQLDFSVEENSSKETRTATITISSGSLRQTIQIEQLPTTHFPETEEEWEESYEMTFSIAERITKITNNNKKDNNNGWDTEGIAEQLLTVEDIISAWPDKSGKMIYIMQRDSSVLPVLLEFDEVMGDDLGIGQSNINQQGSETKALTRADGDLLTRVSPSGKERKTLLLSPYQGIHIVGGEQVGLWGIDHNYIKNQLNSIGYSDDQFTYLHDKQVSIEHFYGDFLADYDIVMIATHGGKWDAVRDYETGKYQFDSEGNVLTGDPYLVLSIGVVEDLSFLDGLGTEISNRLERYILNGSVGLCVGVKWFEATTTKRYPNTIVIPLACHSFELDDLSDYFRKNGASVYCGFAGEVLIRKVDPILCSLVGSLCGGMTFYDACSYTLSDDTWTAHFHAAFDGDVFLSDPRSYDLKCTPWDGRSSVTLSWNRDNTLGEYKVYVDTKPFDPDTDKGVSVHDLSVGEHTWYIETTIQRDKKNSYRYKTEGTPFTIEKAPEYITLTTSSAKNVTTQGALFQVDMETNWEPTITERGVVYSSSRTEPEIRFSDCKTHTSAGTSSPFFVQLTGLTAGTTYYARSYVTVTSGQSNSVYYGNTVEFTTEAAPPAAPVLWIGNGTTELTSLNFGTVAIEGGMVKSLTISNSGTGDLVITSVTCPDGYTLGWTSAVIKEGSSQELWVTFRPDSERSYDGALVFTSNNTGGSTFSLPVYGKARRAPRPKAKLSSSYLYFGEVEIGEKTSSSVALANIGDADLEFTITSCPEGFTTNINVGETNKIDAITGTLDITISFNPTEAKTYSGLLVIETNDPTAFTLNVQLRGTGRKAATYAAGAVDLGLSVNWATTNIGASAPEGFGEYYAWGEIKTKSSYTWDNYAYGKIFGQSGTLTKYCTNSAYGTVDNKAILEKSDDVAFQKRKSSWRIPLSSEFEELLEKCTWTRTTLSGANVYKITGTNGNSIYIPAAAHTDGTDGYGSPDFGYYWAADIEPSGKNRPAYLYFSMHNSIKGVYKNGQRYVGASIRPVCDK